MSYSPPLSTSLSILERGEGLKPFSRERKREHKPFLTKKECSELRERFLQATLSVTMKGLRSAYYIPKILLDDLGLFKEFSEEVANLMNRKVINDVLLKKLFGLLKALEPMEDDFHFHDPDLKIAFYELVFKLRFFIVRVCDGEFSTDVTAGTKEKISSELRNGYMLYSDLVRFLKELRMEQGFFEEVAAISRKAAFYFQKIKGLKDILKQSQGEFSYQVDPYQKRY